MKRIIPILCLLITFGGCKSKKDDSSHRSFGIAVRLVHDIK